MTNLRKITVKIPSDTYMVIETIAKKNGSNISETIRTLLSKSLNIDWFNDNQDIMSSLIRQQMEIVIKPHIERLAALSAKGGHMSATATFLNVQALQDLVLAENKKDVRALYDKARIKAVEYLQTNTKEYLEKDF